MGLVKQIAVLPGDGIGPEVTNQAIKVLRAVAEKYHHEFRFENALIGGVAIDATGDPLPVQTLEKCERADAILLGAVGMPKYDNDPNATVRPEQGLLGIRKALRLFLNVRPLVIFPQMASQSSLKPELLTDVDLTIYRELSSGIYFGEKHEATKATPFASDLCTYTSKEIRRVVKRAFVAATNRNGKLCLVDKANVLATSRLWRRVVQKMAADYDEVEVSYQYIDNAAMQLVLDPSQFDVIVTSNMFGDILSDLGSAIAGSLGVLPSGSYGKNNALFEPVHGSYPQAAGKDIANPVAAILSAKMMLEYFELYQEAAEVTRAVRRCMEAGVGTPDISPAHEIGCARLGDFIAYLILDHDFKLKDQISGSPSSTII